MVLLKQPLKALKELRVRNELVWQLLNVLENVSVLFLAHPTKPHPTHTTSEGDVTTGDIRKFVFYSSQL